MRTMGRVAAAVATLSVACLPPVISYEGKGCDPVVGCFSPLACDPYTLTCEVDAGFCPSAFVPPACPLNGRDFYLDPAGDDGNAGSDPGDPRLTMSGITSLPGDRIHLAPGVFAQSLALTGQGGPACPIRLIGEAGGGSILAHSLNLLPNWWLSAVSFEVPTDSDLYALVVGLGARDGGRGEGVRVEGCHFRDPDVDGGAPYFSDIYADGASGGAIVSCDFRGQHQAITSGNSLDLLVRGNAIDMQAINLVPAIGLDKTVLAPSVEANVFTGSTPYDVFVVLGQSPQPGSFQRNVVHDISMGGNSTAVSGNATVSHNTLWRLGPNATAADSLNFADNIVGFTGRGGVPTPGGGTGNFNLFWNVQSPYASSGAGKTDVLGDPLLDPTSWIPDAGSPAIDAADPRLPVPAGGGARGDIGARERGATALPDGTYCAP